MTMDLTNHNRLGTFTCGGKLRVTDPCYDRDTWCTVVLDVEPGEYTATAKRERFFEWGVRFWELAVVRSDVSPSDLTWEQVDGEAGVDSGQCGFYDDAEYSGDTGEYDDESSFYRRICDESHSAKGALREHGIFTSSGLGDGGYPVLVGRNAAGVVVGAAVVFLNEDEDEDEDSAAED
jgi:hypothetical protein